MLVFIIITVVLDNIFHVIFTNNLYSLIMLTSIIFINKYFKAKKGLIISIILGFIFDIMYSNILFLNTYIFILSSILINYYFRKYKFNIISIIISANLIIIFYHLIYYLLILASGNIIDVTALVKAYIDSIVVNNLYVIFSYFILNRVYSYKNY